MTSAASDLWYVLRTNPRCERRAVACLQDEGYSPYMPMGKSLIVHHRTRKLIPRDYPLFVGYLFLPMPPDPRRRHWGVVRQCDGVKAILGVNGTPEPISTADLMNIQKEEARIQDRFEERMRALNSKDHGYKKGDTVMIKKGPMAQFIGTVVDARSRRAIRVVSQLFGHMTEIKVPVDYIEIAA